MHLLLLWIALFLWGMHAPMGRFLALDGIPILSVMAARLWIGTFVFAIFLLATRRFSPPFAKWRSILPLSFVGVFLNSMVFHLGMPYIPGTLIMLLENLAPFFVILFAWRLDGKKPSRGELGAVALGFAGLGLIVWGKGGIQISDSDFYLGVFFELLAGFTWAVYVYFSARWLGANLPDTMPARERFFGVLNFLFIQFGISALLSTPLLLEFRGAPFWPEHVAMILVLGVFQSGLTFIFWNYALLSVSSLVASVAFYMTVVFTCVNEVLFMGLKLNPVLLLGGAVILASVLWLSLQKGSPENLQST